MKRLITHLALALLMVGGLGMTILPAQVAHAAAVRPLGSLGDTSSNGPSTTNCGPNEEYAYAGTDNPPHLYLNFLNNGGPQGYTDYTNTGVSITCFHGYIYFAWHSDDSSNKIWIGYDNGSCPLLGLCTLNGRLTIPGQTTYFTPALGTSCDGSHMYAAWEGTTNNHIYIEETVNGTSWNTLTQLADTTIDRPALTCFQSHLYVAWAGTDNPAHIWFGYYTDGQSTLSNHGHFGNETTFSGVGLSTYTNRLQVAWQASNGTNVVYSGSWAPPNDWVHNGGLPGAPQTYWPPALNGKDCFFTQYDTYLYVQSIY